MQHGAFIVRPENLVQRLVMQLPTQISNRDRPQRLNQSVPP